MRKSYMSGAEYHEAMRTLGLNLQSGARFMRVHRKTSEHRAGGRMAIDWDTATLLRLMMALKLKPEHLARIVPLDYNAPHGGESNTVGQVPKRKAGG